MKFSSWLKESVEMVKEVDSKQPKASKKDSLEKALDAAEVAYQDYMEAFFEGVDHIREASQGDDVPDAEELYDASLGMVDSMNALKSAVRAAKLVKNLREKLDNLDD